MKKGLAAVLMAVAIVGITSAAMADVIFGQLYYEGRMVRTVVPPATMSKLGRDNFYGFPAGIEGQLGIAAVAPGDRGYHGGKWAFHKVVWNEGSTPEILTSEDAVLAAEDAEDVTVTRVEAMDFKCPIQP